MRRPFPLPALLLSGFAASLLSGCAARAGFTLMDAERTYKEAVEAGAEERAVYQATLAYEYLQKAKEEVGYSDYGAADQLCRASKQAAMKAVKESEERGVKVKDPTALPESIEDKEQAPSTRKPVDEDEEGEN